MNNKITGLHHVTAMTALAQQNVDFYAGILSLRMIKKTVNFDAPDVYHLYYGNEPGTPGTIMTFFSFPGMARGRKGTGQLTVTSFSIPENALDYWMKRLTRFKIPFKNPEVRFDEVFIYFEDHDGHGLELVACSKDERKGFTYGNVPEEFAVKGFYGVLLNEQRSDNTIELLTDQMDHRLVTEKGNRSRFSPSGKPGGFIDILSTPGELRGTGGTGTVHHVAFATPDDKSQTEFRKELKSKGIVDPTPVIDRHYFHSIYFREPGGILFEVATSDIGFTIDEPLEHLGENLKLPPWVEPDRKNIESLLTPINLDTEKFTD